MNDKHIFSITIFYLVSTLFLFNNCDNNDDNSDTIIEKEDSSIRNGKIPFDFPVVTTTAKSGEYVLAPSLLFVEDAWKDKNTTFVFYSRKCIETGKTESKLSEIRTEVLIPNSLIIPIPVNEIVQKGDVVLTWWQSGTGISRAIIVDATNTDSPVAKYLDITYENKTTNDKGIPIGQMEEQLAPKTFVKIKKELQAGTSVAYKEDNNYLHYQVIRIEGDKVLAKSFWAGKMKVLNILDCIAIPIKLEINKGDNVQVPYMGSFIDGVVKKYDETSGRVFVKIVFNGEKNEIVVSVGNITKNLTITN